MAKTYHVFAEIYDACMADIPYDEWCAYLNSLLKEYHVYPCDLIAELGCGTGEITQRLRAYGYDMIGIDASEEMLSVARDKQYDAMEDEASSILYLQQDMRQFELFGTVKAIVSLCDTMNYLESYSELVQVLSLCNNYLEPSGVLIFDMKSLSFYQNALGNQTFQDISEDYVLLWDNFFDQDTRNNEYHLTMFLEQGIEEETQKTLYIREEEVHMQHAFTIEEVRRAVCEAGLSLCAIYKVMTKETVSEDCDCERFYVIAKECQK